MFDIIHNGMVLGGFVDSLTFASIEMLNVTSTTKGRNNLNKILV